ncbi:glycosyltransferase family 4 protein [Hymenobacter sublimis]|uniref:Glycosyltransferase family 4 protein n=2 Tax=Hymenobacter TaxID=89966 RepID=A0ABY4JAJ4_9BACT|nr:glycosyltransferase family 4 protein [Hymenobacter sublimis]UPL49839.1 glycosyltransferase family 4 protein [Hymenobacter sublimis]
MMFLYTIVRHKIEVVHSHEILTKQSRLNAVLRFLSVPIVVTDHSGYTMLRKVQDVSFIPYANKARAIIAVSEYAAKALLYGDQSGVSEQARALGQKIIASDYHTEAETLKHKELATGQDEPLTVPVATIYNGVLRHQGTLPPPEVIHQELGIAPGSFVFGMGGRGTEQKGWHYALAAYQQLKQRHPTRKFAWLCMGEGPCLTAMQHELGDTAPDIIFLGNVQNPHYYMSACRVGLVPSSFNEGLPLTIVEFFEHRVPVIASDLCGIPEVIVPANHEPGGLLIEMEEDLTPRIASLLKNMEAYVTQPELWEEHAQAALSIRKMFDVEEFVQAHEQLYTKVLFSSK